MDRKTIILGKKIVGRKETLEYVAQKYNWRNCIIGISCFFGFWAWIWGRLTGKKVIYYCIDFYSPKIAVNKFDALFIWLAMQMDKFLIRHCDEIWDISTRINRGRFEFGGYMVHSKVIPLSYPPSYFKFNNKPVYKNTIVFVGLDPYGLELLPKNIDFVWLGKDKLLPLDELLDKLSNCGIGISLWKDKGNNYYGDPGKTKLYSACGLPVIMTGNTPYAMIIQETQAGLIIEYSEIDLENAIQEILHNYNFYKNNVRKTWKYINADEVFRNRNLLE